MTDTQQLPDLWAVVPAGGAGTRLWPLSRRTAPKFLLDLTGAGRTLLQSTVDRLAPLAGDRVMVVTGAVHADAVRAQLPEIDGDRVVAEPSPRDSMAAIGLAAAFLEASEPDAVMASFAADHVITDTAGFQRAVTEAVEAARLGWLVTIGIQPTGPATGFGYIRSGADIAGTAARVVEQFVEKPSREVAQGYLATGAYRWNAGMFVVRPGVLLELLAETDPAFAKALRGIAADPSTLPEVWPTLPKIAIDHAVAEPAAAAGRVASVTGGFGWDDVGDFASLGDLLRDLRAGQGQQAPDVEVIGDAALVRTVDAGGLVVPASGRTVAVIGLDDVVVVDTPDALLVTTRERAQEVKAIVAGLTADGRADLT
ncbi:mannose-1-phosphate guanylyltransferase [Nocardioides yefusunii]|uniref:Mannose-1-phosphate guanylyltransferase n=1 Tax=Nocardioides yefusunii TaxID=2500546 RepID=A0ABW1QY26_9ACTN|nr:mannose-1-phosphate guanylyltransferase [Nocardioides yefusunii]